MSEGIWGSPSEAKRLAEVFCSVLSHRAIMIPCWDAPEFYDSVGVLESLMSAFDIYDGGIFVIENELKVSFRRACMKRDEVSW